MSDTPKPPTPPKWAMIARTVSEDLRRSVSHLKKGSRSKLNNQAADLIDRLASELVRNDLHEVLNTAAHVEETVGSVKRHHAAAQAETVALAIPPKLAELLVDALYESENVLIVGDGCRSEDRDKFLIRSVVFTTLGLPMPSMLAQLKEGAP